VRAYCQFEDQLLSLGVIDCLDIETPVLEDLGDVIVVHIHQGRDQEG